jgi:hypothetical protein
MAIVMPISAAVAADLVGASNTPITLKCTSGLFTGGRCETAHTGYKAGTWETVRIELHYVPAAGWEFTGAPQSTYKGQEVFDVLAYSTGINQMKCEWHTEGSKQVFGPGGWVDGYCWVPARKKRAE